MKLFTFIFSFYILSLSGLPCNDEVDCMETKTETNAASQHTDHEQDTETCSPFCICACCGSTIVSNFLFTQLISEKKQSFLSEKLKINFYKNTSISDFFGNIWQPPKI